MTPRELADLCERAPGFDAETLQEIADTLRAQAEEIARLKAEATTLANQSFLTIKSWKDMINALERELTGQIDDLKVAAKQAKVEQSALFDNWEETRMKLALCGDEIDALKAAAIVQGSLKLDQAAKMITQIEGLQAEAVLRAQQVKNLMAEVARLKDVVRHAEYWEAVRKEERNGAIVDAGRLRAEVALLRAEISIHDTPEKAKGLMEE